MCLALLGAFTLTFAIPPIRELFRLAVPDGEIVAMIALGVAVGLAILTAFGIRPGRETSRPDTDSPPVSGPDLSGPCPSGEARPTRRSASGR
jgi:hypothetical protein